VIAERGDTVRGSIRFRGREKSMVFLLAENRLLREALSRLLQRKSGISVVGECLFSDSAIERIAESGCDVLLLDCQTTTVSNPDLIGEILKAVPGVKVLLLGMEEDENSLLRAVQSGVMGYLLKEASAVDVIAAVRTVALGEAVCPPKLCASLFQYIAKQSQGFPIYRIRAKLGLTHRQQQLVALVAKGWTNKEIACDLNLSDQTVKNHMHRILRRVNAENRYEAVETVRTCGLLG
jgi:DNA-binding NarL/FixJ family response regulator